MRTKFLTPNYFAPTLTLEILRFPIPPPPNDLSSVATAVADLLDDLLCCVDSSTSAASPELPNLPIDDALSKFCSDVLPHTIDIDYELLSSSPVQVTEERCEDTVGDSIEKYKIVHFEVPELSQDVENSCLFEKENFQFLSEAQEHDDNLEGLNLMPTDLFGFDTKDSVNSVENICLEDDVAQKLQIPEDIDLLPNKGHLLGSVFPLLEVDETEPADFTWFRMEDGWEYLVEAIDGDDSASYEDPELSFQDLLVSSKIDILEHISDCHTSKVSLEFCQTSEFVALDVDILQLLDIPYTESKDEVEISSQIPSVEMFLYEEFEMFDSGSFDVFEELAVSQTAKEQETCDQLFQEDLHFKSFYELIVSSELAIVDCTFTTLPVPLIADDEEMLSVDILGDGLFAELELLPFSTSDEIYLDWRLLGNDKCNGHVNAAIEKVFNDVEDITTSFQLEPSDCILPILDCLPYDAPLSKLNTKEDKLDMPFGGSGKADQNVCYPVGKRLLDDSCVIIERRVKIPKGDSVKFSSDKLPDDDCQIIEVHQMPKNSDLGNVKVSSSFKSMPGVNDLDFFLNPRKAASGMRTDHRSKPLVAKSMLSGNLGKEAAATSLVGGNRMEQSYIQSHTVSLSPNILILVDSLRRSYLAICRDEMQLNNFAASYSDDLNLLSISEQKLMGYLSRSSNLRSLRDHRNDNAVEIITLCALKRMVWCLCYYGIYNLYLFKSKLCQSLAFMEPRLRPLCSMISDAFTVVENDITKSHPTLAFVKEILLQNNIRAGKVLILAQPDLWRPLKRLLTLMNICCNEVDLSNHGIQSYDLFAGGLRDRSTACVLMKHEHISESILRQKFDLIVECGGPCSSSKLTALYREYIVPLTFHFVKIELNDVAKALSEGLICGSDRDTIKLEELLNFQNLIEKSSISCSEPLEIDPQIAALPTYHMAEEPEAVQPSESSFPDMVIIVNTKDFDREMIMSRRSTYQKLLSMETKGAQIVERDLLLSVDIVLDATTCMVWYDCNNVGKKSVVQDVESSSIPLCIENIAANVLTSLSFTFTACVLIFEGDCKFIATVMEFADEIYAAAASLGINLQIFYSHSYELTDEIILNLVSQARERSRGLISRMPEIETHAESFLTKFPSLNPLSAHAIISCGCKLLEFLEFSGDKRIQALRKYHLSEESVNLLCALLKYGEREESKSGVTDCSSSVSSPPESGKFDHRINSTGRKRKFIPDSSDDVNNLRCSEPSKEYIDDWLNYHGRPSVTNVSQSPRIFFPKKVLDFSLDDDLFCDGNGQGTATAAVGNSPKAWSETYGIGTTKITRSCDDFANTTLFPNDGFGEPIMDSAHKRTRQECAKDKLKDLHGDLVGEVVDMYENSSFGVDFHAAGKAFNTSPMDSETVIEHSPRYCKTSRRLSFGSSSYLNIPTADNMYTSCELEDNRHLRADNDYDSMDFDWGKDVFKPEPELMGKSAFEKSSHSISDPFSKEKVVPSHGETPLLKAVHSAQLQQGSPWTIQFLNRIKEKRRFRQQNQPCGTSVAKPVNGGNVGRFTKKRSPSILDYYKYQGGFDGHTPRKATPLKQQKQQGQLSNKRSSGLRSWTPIDKRARRNLTFETSGSGSQTKLVWRNNFSCNQDSRFSN